jgi:hypothetical protein
MSDITVDLAQYTTDTTLNGAYNPSDNVTLADDSSILDTLTDAQIDSLGTNNVDTISATDGVLSWTADQFAHFILVPVAIDQDTFAVLADTGADIAALSAAQISAIATDDVAVINPTDGMLTFSVGQFNALGAMSVDASADFTIADTSATLESLSPGAIGALASLGVDAIDATDNVLALNVAQYQALGTVTLTAGDDVTLADTGANLGTLSSTDFGNLGANGIDHIDATDNVLTLSLADFNALGSVTLTLADVVTLADAGATISGFSTTEIDTLATGGIDVFDATDNAISFTVAQYNETVTDHIALTAADTVTLADSGGTLSLLTATEINALVNVDAVDATDNTLVIAVDQFDAFVGKGITLASNDAVTISDTAANLATLDFSTLAAANVDQLDSTTAFTTLTVANLTALGTVIFSAASAVTLTDTGAAIAGVSNFATFAAHGIDTLDASDNTLTISEAQFQALGTTTLTGADVVTISDTAANIVGGPNYGTLAAAGVDFLNATTAINVTTNDISNLGAVVFTAGSTVTLADTGAHIAAIANFTTYGTHGVDTIDATNNTLTMNATQFGELGAVTLTAGDTVTISDTATHLGGLTFSTLAGKNIDFLNSTNAYTNLTVQNVTDLGAVHFTAASNVTLTDTAADIQAVSDFTTFATHGVDTIKSSDNALSVTVAQYSGLGTTHLTTADAVTLADSAANLNTYFATFGAASTLGTALSTNGVDSVHATGGTLSVNGQGALGVFDGNATFLSTDTVTLADTGNTIAVAISTILSHSGHLATLGVDVIDATNNVLNLTAAEYLDLAGNVALTAGDLVTISDTAANIEALNTTQIGGLGTNLIDAISVTSGGDLDWSVAQWQALPGGISLSDTGGELVVDDSETTLEGLTGTQFGALATSGAQELASTEGVLNLSVSQAEGFLGTGLAIASGDAATLSDTGTAIAGMTATQIGQLAAAGFDTVDASDNALTLNAAQLSALGAVHDASGDDLTLADTASNIDSFLEGASAGVEIASNGVDTIHATGGTLSVTASELNNTLGTGAVFESTDTVTLADTGTAIAALNFSPLAGLNIDTIDASDNTLSITLDQYNDIAGVVALTVGDDVTVTGSLNDLSTTDIAAFGTNHVDHLLDTDSEVLWNVAQWNALATTVTIDNSAHTPTLNFVFDSAANLSAVTATQVANFVAEGAETWEESPAGSDALVTWTVANTQAMGSSTFSGNSHVTVVDSAATIQAVGDFTIFAAHGIDTLDSSDDTLSLTTAQFGGLGTTTLTGADAVTLADTAAHLNTYLDGSAANGALTTNGVDFIHATGGAISVDETALSHLDGTGTVFLSTDTVTFADTGAHIAAFDFTELSGLNVDTIDATNNILSISLGQYEDIAGVVALTAGDNVTVTGDVDNLSTTEIASFATNHVDHVLDADGFNEVIWNVAQWNALTTAVTIDNANHLSFLNVVFDSGANLSAVTTTQIANFVTEGAEVFEGQPPGEESVSWDVAQLQAMGSAVWASTTVTIYDTGAALQAVSDYTLFSSHGITAISATDGSLTLTAAQFGGLGTVTVDAADTFTVSDTAANIEAMGVDGYTAMASAGVDFIHATGGSLTVTYDEFSAIASSSTAFVSLDTVTLTGTQAQLFDAHPASYFSALGATFHIDEISLTGTGIGHLAVDQWNALVTGGTTLDEDNDITILDTAANLSAETATDITGMDDVIDHWQVSDGQTAVLSKAQLDALISVSISITPTSAVILFSDTETTVEGLTATQLESYITEGVNAFRASDTSTLNLSVSQVTAVVDNGAYFVPANTVALVDTAAAIGGLSAVQYGELVAGFVDAITATDGTLQMSVADFEAIKTALHSGSLTLTNAAQLADAGTTISALTTTELGQLSGDNITSISATGDVTFSQAQITALGGGVTVTATGHFILADSEANIEALTTATIDSDAAAGLTTIHATDVGSTLHFTATQAQHILSDGLSVNNTTVTVTDTGAHLSTLSFAQLNGMSTAGFTGIVDSSGTITWSVSQLNHLTVPLTLNGNGLTLSDTEATLEAQNQAEWLYIASLATNITASNTHILNLSAVQIGQLFGSGATFATGDTVTLADTSTHINALTATQIGELAGLNVDAINASDDQVTWNIAQFGALGTVTLTAGDTVTLSDSSTNLETLNFSALAGAGVDVLDATDNVLTLTAAQFTALGAVALTAGDLVTISDTASHINALNFATLAAANVDVIDVTTPFSLNVARYQSMGAVKFASGDTVTLSDSGAHISAMTSTQFAALAGNGITVIDASDNVLSLTAAQFSALGAVTLTQADVVTLSDIGANIAALSNSTFAGLAAAGIDKIDASDNSLILNVAQYTGLGAVTLTLADTVILKDTGAALAALSVAQFMAFAGAGIDKIDASNNVLSLSVAQYQALGSTILTNADTVTLLDSGAHLAALTATDFSHLAGKGVDILDASDNMLTLTAAQFQNLGTVSLKSSDTVTLLDTGADISGLTAAQFNALAAKGIDILDASDNAYSLTVAQVEGLGALTLAANDVVTVADTEANIEGLSAFQIEVAIAEGADLFHATNSTLNMSVAQVSQVLGSGAAFAGGDTVTLIDAGANVQGLSATQIGELSAAGVDKIDTTDNTLTLNIAQYEALGSVQLSAGDTNTLADAYIPGLVGLSTTVIAGLGAAHIDHIHGTFMFEWSVAQYAALATNITIDTAFGLVRLFDTGAAIESLTPTQIATFHTEGLAQLEIATHGGGSELDFSVAQTNAITTAGLSFSTDNASTANPIITDTGTAIAAMTATQIAAAASDGFTGINASDGALTLSLAQFNALGGIALTAANTVTIADTEANIEALTNAQFAAMVSNHVDVIHAANSTLNVSISQVSALLGTSTHFASGDTVTLVDTSLSLSNLVSGRILQLAAAGIDTIDASDNFITFDLAQYNALGTVTLTQANTVTIENDNIAISVMSVAEIQGLAASGIDVLESNNGNFSFSAAQADAFVHQTGGGHVALTAGDTFFVNDTAANVGALSLADIAAFGALGAGSVDLITSGTLTFNLAYYNAAVAAGVMIDAGDNTVLADTGANIRALTVTQIGALAGNGVDTIDATDNAIVLSVAQLNALGAVALTPADAITMSDGIANLRTLTAAQFTAFATQGVDFIRPSAALSLNESQIAAIVATNMDFSGPNAVTLVDIGANIASLSAGQFGQLAAHGVDAIDASDDTLSLSIAQYNALGTVTLTSTDVVTLADASNAIAALTATQIAALGAGGIDVIHASNNNTILFTAAQAHALVNQTSGAVAIAGSDALSIEDTGAHIDALSVADLNALGSDGATGVQLFADDNLLSFNVAQYTAIAAHSIQLNSGNTVTLADSGSALSTYLTPVHIAALSNIDAIDASDNAITLSVAQLNALATATVALTGADTVTLTDTETNIEALTASQFTSLATQGVDVFHASNGILSLSEAKVAAVLNSAAAFKGSDAVTLTDTATNIQALSATQFGQLAAKGVDLIDITTGTLTLSVADYTALGAFTIVGGTASLIDTGGDIATLTATQLGALTGTDITHINATDNALTLSVAQLRGVLTQTAGGTVTFDGTDTVTIADAGAQIANLSASELTALGGDGAGHVVLDASDNVLTITTAQYNAITSASIALTAADSVTLADIGANLASLNSTQLAALSANNVDAIHATDGAVTFSIAQLNALHTANIALTPSDTVTLSDTQTNIQALTGAQLAGYATQGVDVISSTSATLSLTASQVSGFLPTAATFAAGNMVTLFDTGASIDALTAAQFALLATHGVDTIDASDNALFLTAAQYSGLGATTLTGADVVTLSDTGAHIDALTATQFSHFAANGIDTIDASNNSLAFSVAQYQALGAVTLTQSDTIALFDTGAALGALTASQIGQLAAAGIDNINATDNVLSLSLAQFNALGTVTLTNSDVVTLVDASVNLDALTATQLHALAGAGIDAIDASDNVLSFSVAQYQALGHVALTQADTVTLSDLGANIATLSAAKIGALAGAGIDAIDATDNAITFSLGQYTALGTVHLSLTDTITVNGTTGTDLIQGGAESDVLKGAGGDDVLFGQGGNDVLDGGLGNDTLNGGTGNNTATYADATASVTVSLVAGTATGGAGTDLLSNIENITGSNFADTLTGDANNNTIDGGAGNDVITGGSGVDTFIGGTGADHFVFNAVSDSSHTTGIDTIMDFSHAQGDLIDVSAIGNFTFVTSFTHHADQLEIVSTGVNTYQVRADVNGDGSSDLVINVHSTTALVAGDFIL